MLRVHMYSQVRLKTGAILSLSKFGFHPNGDKKGIIFYNFKIRKKNAAHPLEHQLTVPLAPSPDRCGHANGCDTPAGPAEPAEGPRTLHRGRPVGRLVLNVYRAG